MNNNIFYHLNSFSKKTCVIHYENKNIRSKTYEEILFESNIIGKYFKKRSLVFILSSNTIGSLIGYISLLSFNNVLFLIDHKTKKNDIEKLINLYKPDYLYSPNTIIFYNLTSYPANSSYICFSIFFGKS